MKNILDEKRNIILSLLIRIISAITRSILVILIAKYLTPEDNGIFNLISTSITILIFIIGLDFYSFSNREMLSEINTKAQILYNQIITQTISLAFFLLIILLVVNFIDDKNIINNHNKILLLLLLLLISEYISQETHRIQVALRKPINANFYLFIRRSLWVIPLALLFAYKPDYQNLQSVLLLWLLGSILSSFLSSREILKEIDFFDVKKSFDWKWIKYGLKISSVFLYATITLKITESIDRYMISYLLGNNALGVYAFYMSIYAILQIVVISGSSSILYPKLISSFKANQINNALQIAKEMMILSFSISLLGIISSVLIIDHILEFIDNNAYRENASIFYIIIFSIIPSTLSLTPHYILYALNKDKVLFFSTIPSLIIITVGNYLLIPAYGLYAAATVQIFSNTILLVIKSLLAIKAIRRKYDE